MKCDRWPILVGGGFLLAPCSSAPPPAKLQLYRMVNVAGTPEAVARCVQAAMVAKRYGADLTTVEPTAPPTSSRGPRAPLFGKPPSEPPDRAGRRCRSGVTTNFRRVSWFRIW
jgi:hypothetical protein